MGLVFLTILVYFSNSSSSKFEKSADSSIIFVPPTCPKRKSKFFLQKPYLDGNKENRPSQKKKLVKLDE